MFSKKKIVSRKISLHLLRFLSTFGHSLVPSIFDFHIVPTDYNCFLQEAVLLLTRNRTCFHYIFRFFHEMVIEFHKGTRFSKIMKLNIIYFLWSYVVVQNHYRSFGKYNKRIKSSFHPMFYSQATHVYCLWILYNAWYIILNFALL